ncbi:MAG TPA: hypothetical protein VGN13_07480 [Solirubrobacteraceae bacterium]|jgi:hypothetical protein
MTTTRLHRTASRAFSAVLLACATSALLAGGALGATQEDKAEFSVKAGSLSFSSTPSMPALKEVTLTGGSQTTNTTMTNFGAQDATGSGSGWNVTVAGQSGSEKSAVFAQYCPTATCGTDVKGYVAAGAALPAGSLTLNSTGATFSAQNGSTGTAPTLQCAASCNIDSASAVKIASGAEKAGMGTWLTTGFSATSLALATSSTLKALANGEIYRVNLLWTLSTGP